MKLVLSIDTEADFWKYIQAPFGSLSKEYKLKWHLNLLRGRVIYAKNRRGLINLVNFLKKQQIPATFNITGHLYLRSCNGWPHFNEKKPDAKWFFKPDWYYWDRGGDFNSRPGLYLGDYIEKEMKTNPLFDLGIHGFAHECLPLEKQDVADNCINAAISAAKQIKIKPVSASAPFNITEDMKFPSTLYPALKKNGIKVVRYMGYEDYPKTFYHQFKVLKPYKKDGLIFVNGSNYFEGTSSLKHVKSIIKDIEKNLDKKEAVYCLCCHDFTFKNTKNLKLIFDKVLQWQEEGKIEVVTMEDIFNAY